MLGVITDLNDFDVGDTVERSEMINLPHNAVLLKPLPRLYVGVCIECHADESTLESPERQLRRLHIFATDHV